jgi:hypothetical protein
MGRPARGLEKLQAGWPNGVEKLDGLDGLNILCEVVTRGTRGTSRDVRAYGEA